MKFTRAHLYWLIPLLLVVLLVGVGLFAGLQANTNHNPSLANMGGDPSLLAQITDGIRSAEYAYTWHESSAAWLASNPAQGWYTSLGADGLHLEAARGSAWHFGLRLSAWGRAGCPDRQRNI